MYLVDYYISNVVIITVWCMMYDAYNNHYFYYYYDYDYDDVCTIYLFALLVLISMMPSTVTTCLPRDSFKIRLVLFY
jgi:hypothetical protein